MHGLLDPLFLLIIWSLAGGGGLLGRALATPALCLLGEASYALYLLHWAILLWIVGPLGARPTLAILAAYWVAAIGAAIVLYRVLEVPARRAIRERFGGVTVEGEVRQ